MAGLRGAGWPGSRSGSDQLYTVYHAASPLQKSNAPRRAVSTRRIGLPALPGMQQRVDGEAAEEDAGEPDQPELVAGIEAGRRPRADQPDEQRIGGEEPEEASRQR